MFQSPSVEAGAVGRDEPQGPGRTERVALEVSALGTWTLSLCVPAMHDSAPSPLWGPTGPSIARTENLMGVMLAVTGLLAPGSHRTGQGQLLKGREAPPSSRLPGTG